MFKTLSAAILVLAYQANAVSVDHGIIYDSSFSYNGNLVSGSPATNTEIDRWWAWDDEEEEVEDDPVYVAEETQADPVAISDLVLPKFENKYTEGTGSLFKKGRARAEKRK